MRREWAKYAHRREECPKIARVGQKQLADTADTANMADTQKAGKT